MSFKRNFMIQIPKRLPKRCVLSFASSAEPAASLASIGQKSYQIKRRAFPEFAKTAPIVGVLPALHEPQEKAASAEDA
jgi:hypothetical protein